MCEGHTHIGCVRDTHAWVHACMCVCVHVCMHACTCVYHVAVATDPVSLTEGHFPGENKWEANAAGEQGTNERDERTGTTGTKEKELKGN